MVTKLLDACFFNHKLFMVFGKTRCCTVNIKKNTLSHGNYLSDEQQLVVI